MLRPTSRCSEFLSFLSHHPQGFIVQPIPYPGHIELSSVVFPWRQLRQQGLFFSECPTLTTLTLDANPTNPTTLPDNFTRSGISKFSRFTSTASYLSNLYLTETSLTAFKDHQYRPDAPVDVSSAGPQYLSPFNLQPREKDQIYEELLIVGYFVQYLTRYLRWGYDQLPLHSLSSLVASQAHSPTYCLASGRVWFEHPTVWLSTCNEIKFVDKLHARDIAASKRREAWRYDWAEYERNSRVCLRLSERVYFRDLRQQGEAMARVVDQHLRAQNLSQLLQTGPGGQQGGRPTRTGPAAATGTATGAGPAASAGVVNTPTDEQLRRDNRKFQALLFQPRV